MEVVRGIDLQRYMGRWYEIASFPSFFQPKNGINTRATYTLEADGTTVRVLTRLGFYVPPFLPIIPVVGDYWVLFLDEEYQYALIGQPSRKYLWILCRQTHMDEEIYEMLVEKAKEVGYDVSKLRKTTQTDPPPEGEGPQDTKGICGEMGHEGPPALYLILLLPFTVVWIDSDSFLGV
ncbi:Temperature-induced lipocalin-1 [Vitis vinifera]|uniref:Temperature-induced lipocalin-1 n=1 Tax=Vitis vinifera TaxID=29760 RepID=A0A438GN35_VITVI|nr:Temperature-induced lipocalin-1 [Vitis vinifera]